MFATLGKLTSENLDDIVSLDARARVKIIARSHSHPPDPPSARSSLVAGLILMLACSRHGTASRLS